MPTTYEVHSDLTHGLTSLTADTKLIGESFIPLTVNSTTQLNGNTTFNLNLDSWNHHNQSKGTTVSSSPISITGEATILGDIAYQLDLPSIQVDFNNGEELHLSGLKGQGKGKKTDGYWLGNQNFSLKKFNILDQEQQPIFFLENIQYIAKSVPNEAGDKINSSLLLNAKHLMLKNKGVIENLIFDMAIKSIDRSALANMISNYKNSDELNMQDRKRLLSDLDLLVERGFEMNLNKLSFTLNESKTHSEWLVKVLPGTKSATKDPFQLLSMITGSINTYIAEGLIHSYPALKQEIDKLITLKLVDKQNDGYQLSTRISDGSLTLDNGKELPLISLFLTVLKQ
ncbi:DUF945 domain-containing protein [Vibrio agarivorans]|nr:DUF945 domain-containing protein [Vibrio agarivorans]